MPKSVFDITDFKDICSRQVWENVINCGKREMILFKALFSGLGSIHILGLPFNFCTVTRLLIQSVAFSKGALISLL